MPLACLLIGRGSLSDRALRPRPEAAVLLIFFVAARSILCARQQCKATRRVFLG
jgi:hypothetical protein